MTQSPPQLVVVTGLSGAGRSTAARALEDLGWFVVENLPPSLIPAVVERAARSEGEIDRIAVVVDVRSRGFDTDLRASLSDLDAQGLRPLLVFLDAADDVLIRRFDGVRRPHPLQGDGTVASGIAAERVLLEEVRGEADLVVDTSVLNVHELRAKISAMLGGPAGSRITLTLESFGYKHGVPIDADMVLDCRLLPNPHWVPDLRPLTGLDAPVQEWLLERDGTTELLGRFDDFLQGYLSGYATEGQHFLTVAIGCTGGRHRSVTVVGELARRLADADVELHVVHRDLERE